MSDKDTIYARWLSGEISETELKELKASGEIDELQSIINAVDTWGLPKIDHDTAIEKILRQPKKPKASPKIIRLIWGTAAAASIFLALSIFTLFRNSNTVIRAEYAETRIYELPDGATVSMNDGSTIRYKRRSWNRERSIQLEGEATFDVPKGSPFIVNTSNGTVEVLGTSFNVRSWDGDIVVECYSGKVQVSRLGSSDIIEKDQAVRITDTGNSTRSSIVNSRPLWESGSSKFVDENLGSVFQELERQFDIEVKYPSNNRLFTGTFDHNDLNSALQQICVPMGLNYTINSPDKSVTITEK